jgi:ribulose-bisphosphate carboxylase large chain
MSHPGLLGGLVSSQESGIAHGMLFGTLLRLAGADASIFPSFGGRFTFTAADCGSIASACTCDLGKVLPCMPAPGGGLTPESFAQTDAVYGNDAIYLIGGALRRMGPDLTANCRKMMAVIERSSGA